MSTRGEFRFLVVAASAPLIALGGLAATSVSVAAHPIPIVTEATQAGAPCTVWGFTYHAQVEMAKDSIGTDYVENVVWQYCSRAVWQSAQRTWRYTDGRIVVTVNTNGYVVTAWRR